MPRKAAKCGQTQPKQCGSYTPAPVRGRVIVRHVAGQSNREIAGKEGIDRGTVGRILSQPEITQMMEQYRSRLLMMVPKAISAYEQVLDSDDERVKVAAATKLLEGLQVFPKGSVEPPPSPPNYDENRLIMYGQIMEMMLHKKQRYGIPLPPEFEALTGEGRKKIEEHRN